LGRVTAFERAVGNGKSNAMMYNVLSSRLYVVLFLWLTRTVCCPNNRTMGPSQLRLSTTQRQDLARVTSQRRWVFRSHRMVLSFLAYLLASLYSSKGSTLRPGHMQAGFQSSLSGRLAGRGETQREEAYRQIVVARCRRVLFPFSRHVGESASRSLPRLGSTGRHS
jgi:hypothetical protein